VLGQNSQARERERENKGGVGLCKVWLHAMICYATTTVNQSYYLLVVTSYVEEKNLIEIDDAMFSEFFTVEVYVLYPFFLSLFRTPIFIAISHILTVTRSKSTIFTTI
jgi:hypothetical protein